MAIFGKNADTSLRNFILIAIFIGVLMFIVIILLLSSGDYLVFKYIGAIIENLWWVIFPIPLWYGFLIAWGEYTELMFIRKHDNVLLEIRPPSDTEKSPKVMEQIFAGLHTFSAINKFEKYCGWRPLQEKFTFEIASVEGVVHFYIRCLWVSRDLVESLIYAQYPDAEIFEAEDYTKQVPKVLPNKDWDVWGTALRLHKDDSVPIRTYRSFKEDVTGQMIDPLSSLTEIMSTFSKDEHLWLQFVFTPQPELDWENLGKAKIEEITGQIDTVSFSAIGDVFNNIIKDVFGNIFSVITKGETAFNDLAEELEEEERDFNINQLTPGQQEMLRAIEENISKESFVVTGRMVYVGDRSVFNKARGVAGGFGTLKQFADLTLNSLVPDNRTKTFALYHFTESRMAYRQRKIIQDYRNRAFAGTTFSMSIEELATIYHFPDMSVTTPAIQKIQAKKGDAPFNLPISA